MTKSKKRFLLYLVIPVALVLIGAFVLQRWAKKELINTLDHKMPTNVQLQYEDLELSIFSGTLEIKNVGLKIENKDTASLRAKVNVDAIAMEGVSYWQFLMKNRIALKRASIIGPKIFYYPPGKSTDNHSRKDSIVPEKINSFSLDHFEIKDGQFTLMQKGMDSTRISAIGIEFSMDNIKTDTDIIKNKIPIKYGSYSIAAQDIFVDLGPLLGLNVARLDVDNNNLNIKDLVLKTKYSKVELSKVIKTERDYLDLNVPEVKLNGVDFGFHGERFFTSITEISVSEAKLDIFRDKRVPEDMRYKPLYSKMLRDLPIELTILKTNIADSHINLEQLIEDGVEPGKIFFADINANIDQLANTYPPGRKTKINATSKFMGNAPVQLKWDFDINDESDGFLISGSVQNFDPSTIDSFLKSGLKVEADGHIDQIYFTATGNNNTAGGDMVMKYGDFKFTVLQKDREETNKFLTAIGNLFVNDGSKSDGEGYRHGKIEVERNTNKSFFNYLWVCVRSGVVSTLTGLGMKPGKFHRMEKKKAREESKEVKKENKKEANEKKKEEKKEN